MTSIDELVARRQAIKQQIERCEDALSKVDEDLISRMSLEGQKSAQLQSGDKVTVVRGTTKTIHKGKVRQILEEKGLWQRAKVVREEVDEKKVELLIDAGELAAADLAPALTVTPKKPYVKITQRRAHE